MAIICISRELAANGEETGRELAKLAGYRFIERGFIDVWLAEHDIGPQVLNKYDERKPGFFAAMPEHRDEFLHYLGMAIIEEAADNHCVFVGRGAVAILSGIPGVISVLLTAPDEIRIQRLAKAHGIDKHLADTRVRRSDHDRKGFYRYFFHRNWLSSRFYDLIINTEVLSPLQAARIIDSFRREISTPENEMHTLAALQQKLLEKEVIHAVLYKANIDVHNLIVVTAGHTVTLKGYTETLQNADRATTAARGVDGVIAVNQEISIVPNIVA